MAMYSEIAGMKIEIEEI